LAHLIGVVKAESKENIDSRAKGPIYAGLTARRARSGVIRKRR
jgi:hypothetical protein